MFLFMSLLLFFRQNFSFAARANRGGGLAGADGNCSRKVFKASIWASSSASKRAPCCSPSNVEGSGACYCFPSTGTGEASFKGGDSPVPSSGNSSVAAFSGGGVEGEDCSSMAFVNSANWVGVMAEKSIFWTAIMVVGVVGLLLFVEAILEDWRWRQR